MRLKGMFAVVCAITASLGVAATADAASTVVQQRQPGERLIAHRFEAPQTGRQKLTVVIKPDFTWLTVTLMDVDRDGSPDGLVRMYWDQNNQNVVWQLWKLQKGVMAPALGSDGGTCFTPGDEVASLANVTPADHHVALVKRTNSWAVTVDGDFDQALGGTVRLAPILTTMYTNMATGGLTSSATVQDYLPDSAAGPYTDTSCMGLMGGVYKSGVRVRPERGTDRGQTTIAPARTQTMFDRTENGVGTPDLTEADVDQWTATQPTVDVTADAPASTTATFHPADLVLRFRGSDAPASATYLFPDNPITAGPTGLVVTSASTAGHVRVEISSGLSGLTGTRCYPRDGRAYIGSTPWGASPIVMDLPLTPDGSRVVVRVPLDRMIGVYQDGAGDLGAQFRWITTTLPAGLGEPDFVPDLAQSADPAYCTYSPGAGGTDTSGTTLDPSMAVRMNTGLPNVRLTPSTASPTRGTNITLTAQSDLPNQANGFRFDTNGTGIFDTVGAATTRAASYSATTVARVFATDASGAGQMAMTTISPENAPPNASVSASPAEPTSPPGYEITPSGTTVTWTNTSTDGGSIDDAKTEWTLRNGRTGQDLSQTGGKTLAHTFVTGEHGDWVLTLKAVDNEGASSTTTKNVIVVQKPVAIIDKVTPEGSTEPGPIYLDKYAGGQIWAWMRLADDGSLGSRGPLKHEFDFGDRYSDGSIHWYWWTADQLHGAAAFGTAGDHPVVLRVTDDDGRTSISAPYVVHVYNSGEAPPTANLVVSPSAPVNGDSVLFDGSASTLTMPAASAQRFRYDFGDGTPPMDTTLGSVTHVYQGSGHYTATLIAYDDRNALGSPVPSAPVSVDVWVRSGPGDVNAPKPAIAKVSPEGKVYAKRDVVLSAAGTTVVTGPAHYVWDLDGDGIFETETGTEATLRTTFATEGMRDVRVHVVDGEGREATSEALTLAVAPAPDKAPTVVLNGPDTVTMGPGGTTAQLDASRSTGNNEDDRALEYQWDLDGDGTYETSTGTTAKATARFTVPGDQTIRVLATDHFGNRGTAAKTVFVRSATDELAGCQGREQYRTVTYGPVRATACFTKLDRPNAGELWIARGDLALNGLKLTTGQNPKGAPNRVFADCAAAACQAALATFNDERQGTRIAIDLHDGHLVSNAPIAIKAAGSNVSFTLNDAPLDIVLPSRTGADVDGFLLHPPSGMQLLSLNIGSEAEVRFPDVGEATIGVNVHMPPQLPGASGDVTLRSTESQGIVLDHLKVEVTTGVLSDYLKLGGLSLEYDRPEDQWTGGAELGLPAIKGKEFEIAVEVSVKGGRFKSIYGSVDGLNVALGEGIFLQRIRAGVGVDPLDLQGGLGISAGPKILGTQIFSADGDLRVTFPSPSAPYTLFQIAGGTKLLDWIDLNRGVLRFSTNGFFEARGGMSQTFGGIGYFDADIGGWFTPSKANLSGNAEAGILFFGDKVALARAKAVLSTKGVAACGEVPVIHLGGGVGYKWGGDIGVFEGCDLGPYSETRPAGIPDGFSVRAVSAAARAPEVRLNGGLRSAGITVFGRGGAPKVKVVDADGNVVIDATKQQLTPKAMVVFDEANKRTQILWKAPPKGRYLVMTAEGSFPVAKVEQAVDRGPQRVRATVTGSGAKRKLRWTVTPALQHGQSLELGEAASLDGAGNGIVTTTKSSGAATFAPSTGRGERRVVTATIVTNDLPRPTTAAGSFVAPRDVRPAAPRGLTLTRKGRTVKATWKPGHGAPAAEWRIQLQVGSARSTTTLVAGRKRSFTVGDVPTALAVRGTVAGVSAGGKASAARRATLNAGVARSGAAGAKAALPRSLTARRSGRKLVVRWRPGAEKVRRFSVVIRVGKAKPVRLDTTAGKPSVTLAGLPKKKTAVAVDVHAIRFAGADAVARLKGKR